MASDVSKVEAVKLVKLWEDTFVINLEIEAIQTLQDMIAISLDMAFSDGMKANETYTKLDKMFAAHGQKSDGEKKEKPN